MGKWASQRKTGSANHLGTMAQPDAALFVQTTDSATSELMTFSGTIPFPAVNWKWMGVRVSDGSIRFQSFTATGTLTATGLTTGQVIRSYVAWADAGGTRLGDFVLIGLFTVGA